MSESANQSQPSNTNPKTPPEPPRDPGATPGEQRDAVKFQSKDIGIETAKPQDTFAKQRKEAEKQQRTTKKNRRIIIVAASIFGALLLIGLTIWLVLFLNREPEPAAPTGPSVVFSEGTRDDNLNELSNLATEAYDEQITINDDHSVNSTSNLEAAEEVFDSTAARPENEGHLNDIIFTRLLFYAGNGEYDRFLAYIDQVDPSQLSADEQAQLYNAASRVYGALGDTEKANEYIELNREALSGQQSYGG